MPHMAAIRRLAHSFAVCTVFISFAAFAQTAPTQTAPAQSPSTQASPKSPFTADFDKYPGLLPAVEELTRQLRALQFPAPRSQSDLLPLLPPSTNLFLSMGNYGDVTQRALKVFEQQLAASPALRNWWTHGELAENGPKLEDALGKFSELSQYLGDEVVLSGNIQGKDLQSKDSQNKDPHFLAIARIVKPGLKPLLEQFVKQLPVASGSHTPVHIFDPQTLAAAEERRPSQDLFVLVRPDYVIASGDLPTLRKFNSQLDKGGSGFASSLFGQRIGHSYEGGASMIAGADLHEILQQVVPPVPQTQATLKASGFSDLKYLVWKHTTVNGHSLSETELSFTGPRRGIASWLAAPTQLGSLDFVSPHAMMSMTFVLNNPGRMFDQVQQMFAAANSNTQGLTITPSSQFMGVDIKEDLLKMLAGEITVEIDSYTPPQTPGGKVIVRVNDPQHMQQTLTRMLATVNLSPGEYVNGGVTYHVVQPPPQGIKPFAYAFSHGYLILASSREAVEEAIRLRGSGESLAQSAAFQASLPAGHASGESALFYQDPAAMAKLQMQQVPPEFAQALAQFNPQPTPTVVAVYGEPNSIRSISTSAAADVGAVLIGAAIAVPNLLRSRTAANEAAAVTTMRTLNTAQATYSRTYSDRGFAPDIASLGPNTQGSSTSAEYAGLLAADLAKPTCIAGAWCEKSGYRFMVKAVCGLGHCNNYVAAATPADGSTGARSFCSLSDGVIRFRMGPPLTAAPSLRECRTWLPMQ